MTGFIAIKHLVSSAKSKNRDYLRHMDVYLSRILNRVLLSSIPTPPCCIILLQQLQS